MVDFDKTLFDIDIGSAIFAHSAELDKVAVGGEFFDGVKDIERANEVVGLGEDSVLAVNHRIGGGTLLGEVDDGFRLEVAKDGGQRFVIRHIADTHLDLPARDFAPFRDALLKCVDREQAVEAAFEIEVPAGQVIEDEDIMSLSGQVELLWLSQVATTTENENAHNLFL